MTAPYSSSRYAYEGTETTETSIARAGGAEDPTGQAQIRRIFTTANAQWLRPFRCAPWAVWNETTGADVTVTVYGAGVLDASLTACDVWMDVEYASSTLGEIVTTTRSNILASCTALTSDGSAWTGTSDTQFDPASFRQDGPGEVALSNGNLTVTRVSNAFLASNGARVLVYRTTGKFYFEVTIGLTSTTVSFGIAAFDVSYADISAGLSNVWIVNHTNGGIWNGGYSGKDLGSINLAPGDIIQFAIDLTARMGWARLNGTGDWNLTVGDNPATGTGGVSIPAGSMSPAVGFGVTTSGRNVTYNFGATAFAYTPPAGFGGWDIGSATDLTPFKLVATLNSPQPGRVGLIHVRPKIGKASATVYLDPKIELTPASAAPSAVHLSSRYAYEGTETTETSIVRTGGTAHSRKIVTTANSQWLRPYRAEPYAVWNETVGEDVTVTVYGLETISTLTTNEDIWLEVEYLNATHGTIVTTTKANVLATAASVPSDSSVWSGLPGPFVPTTFDPATVANTSLSLGNLKATHTNTSNNSGARSSAAKSTGKYYFEVTVNKTTGIGDSSGILHQSASFSSMASGIDCSKTIMMDGSITTNDGASGSVLGVHVAGDVMRHAVNLDLRRIWIARNSGAWNALSTHNPVDGLYLSMRATGAFAPAVQFTGSGTAATDARTANFGATPFVYAVPAGYVAGWPDSGMYSAPFKLTATITPQRPGLIHVRPKIGKASATIYLDPTPELT